tara:strand:- start:600 stop:947 length:348 start_codon:yes stop_codon:yes gene_type:complete
MTSFTQAIEKLIRRIKRAFSKGKENKVERLTSELNNLLKQQEHVDENTVIEGISPISPSSSESSESSEEEWSVEENLSENDYQVIGDVTYEEGVADDEPTEEEYLAGKLEQGEEE